MYLPRFVDILAGKAEVGAGRLIVPVRDIYRLATLSNLSPLLRRGATLYPLSYGRVRDLAFRI